MATLTAAAVARRVLRRPGGTLLHSSRAPCSSGATAGSNDAIAEGGMPWHRRRPPTMWPATGGGRRDSTAAQRRPFSSESTGTTATAASLSVDAGGDADPDDPPRRRPRRRRKSKDRAATNAETASAALPPLTEEEYHPERIIQQITQAKKWNQGNFRPAPENHWSKTQRGERDLHNWDYQFAREAVDGYERHLRYVLEHLDAKRRAGDGKKELERSDVLLSDVHPSPERCAATHELLSPVTFARAVRALTRTRADTPLISRRVRDLERIVGRIGWTPITDHLSYRLLEANGKAGNVRRTLALLELRRRRGYVPREQDDRNFPDAESENADEADDDDFTSHDKTNASSGGGGLRMERGEREFIHAITSIKAAQLSLRRSRNIYLHESVVADDPNLDNPTRYLDAILVNMHLRGVKLRPQMASQMLACYASSGRTGRAFHYFYRVARDPVGEDGHYVPGPHPTHLGRGELEEWKEGRRREGAGRQVVTSPFAEFVKDRDSDDADEDSSIVAGGSLENEGAPDIGTHSNGHKGEMTKVRMIMHPPPPPYKVPSEVRGVQLARDDDEHRWSFARAEPSPSEESSTAETAPVVAKTKYEWETDREWSPTLAAAFAFADSLSHGACGHDAVELDVGGWNCLVNACCRRGAFHRALKILEETMPQRGIEPDVYSYNTLLAGLARVGDVTSSRELLQDMTNKGTVKVDKYTVQAVADCYLNVGDVSGASTLVQDVFNQHDALPPYTTHLKIIEFALANGLVYEAKRHVYFVQQLWKWVPSEHHDEAFRRTVELTRLNPKLSRGALRRLFWHFREELSDGDFF